MTTHSITMFDTTRASVLEVKAPRAARVLARLVVVGLMLIVLSLIFVPWQQNLPGEGRVIAYAPLERQQFIEAPIEGRIQKWHVQEGDRVEKGELIADISDNDPEIIARLERERLAIESRKQATESAIDVVTAKITALEVSRTAQATSAELRAVVGRDRLDAAEQAVTAAEAAYATAKLNIDRHEALFEEGLASRRQLELATMEANTTAANLESARANLKATKREMNALINDAQAIEKNATATIEEARNALATANGELASAEADLAQIDIRLARQKRMAVYAPRTGTILRLIGREGGEIVTMGEPIAGFVPDMESVAVEIWVQGKDGPLISPGRKVRLQFEGWPAVQFMGWPSAAVGTFGGIVEFVDATADARGRFRVVVSPDPNDHPWPESRWLRQGVRAKGWVLLERVRLGFELWRQINGFPPALAIDPETGDPLTSAPEGGITTPPEGT
jgi:adhesin transport system membrane fusion protein